MKRSLRIVLALVAVAAVVVFQHLSKHPTKSPGTAKPAPATASTAAAVKPAAPRTWTLGSLTLTACNLAQEGSGLNVAAWCADVPVPEDRAHPGGRTIKLHMAVVRSNAQVTPHDMVVLLAGGPGQAATQTYLGVEPALQPLLKHRNILLLDQRGTGGSNPLSCKQKPLTGAKAVAEAPATLRKQAADCLQQVQTHADPRFYTTTDAIEDLDAIRRKLGSPKLDLVGISYGTRVAQQYDGRYPGSVRSMILDSVVPNTLVLGETFAANLESALKKDFDACMERPACQQRFGNPYTTLYQLRDTLKAKPQQVTFRDPVSYRPRTQTLDADTLAGVVRLFAYAPETAALLPLSIDKAAHGDAAPLLGQARLIEGEMTQSINSGMSMSVICAEDADQLSERPAEAGTLLGNRLIDGLQAQCSVWPHGRMPAGFHQPLHSTVPTLLMDGSRDPVTPPRYAREVARGLSDARVLVLKGQGHNVIARGCMPRLVQHFIAHPDPKALDATCLKRLRAMPAFLTFNGANP